MYFWVEKNNCVSHLPAFELYFPRGLHFPANRMTGRRHYFNISLVESSHNAIACLLLGRGTILQTVPIKMQSMIHLRGTKNWYFSLSVFEHYAFVRRSLRNRIEKYSHLSHLFDANRFSFFLKSKCVFQFLLDFSSSLTFIYILIA